MTYPFVRNSIMCLIGFPLSAAAQGPENAPYIRDLIPEIRSLVSTGGDLEPGSSGLSGAARQVVKESGNIEVRETDESIVLSVNSDILFGFDSAKLSDEAKSTLADVTRVLDTAAQSVVVRVIGHTDSKGSDRYNKDLSSARAAAVVKFMITDGVERSRLKPEGRGESEPVAANEIDGRDNPDGRALNRRVEFVLPKG